MASDIFRLPHSSTFGTRHDFLKTFFTLSSTSTREQLVTRLLSIHVLYTLQNLARRTGVISPERFLDRARTMLINSSAGNEGCMNVARGLLGPFGPLPPAYKTQRIPEVARKRARR